MVFSGACFSLRVLVLAGTKPRKLKHAPLKTHPREQGESIPCGVDRGRQCSIKRNFRAFKIGTPNEMTLAGRTPKIFPKIQLKWCRP